MAVATKPSRYCGMVIGEAKMLRKFRDHTSSRKTPATPCMTRVKKSKSKTAPSSEGTKFRPDEVSVFKYRVMNPHMMMSMPTQAKMGIQRAGVPSSRQQ